MDHFVEEEDYVEINGKRILKPFVEKPVDGMHVLPTALWQFLLFSFPLVIQWLHYHTVTILFSMFLID